MDKSNKSGAEALIHSLHLEGVELLFGYPGGAALHIYDAIFNQNYVDHILVRHEQGAVHAADGYARATGKPGVALVTSGPGATNAITGLATAYMDSTPIVVISGQVKSNLIGTDSFQETDMIGVSRPIVKHSFLVQKAEDIPDIDQQIKSGNLKVITSWLKQNIHTHGNKFSANEILMKVTGQKLDSLFYKNHLKDRYLN